MHCSSDTKPSERLCVGRLPECCIQAHTYYISETTLASCSLFRKFKKDGIDRLGSEGWGKKQGHCAGILQCTTSHRQQQNTLGVPAVSVPQSARFLSMSSGPQQVCAVTAVFRLSCFGLPIQLQLIQLQLSTADGLFADEQVQQQRSKLTSAVAAVSMKPSSAGPELLLQEEEGRMSVKRRHAAVALQCLSSGPT